MKRSAFAIFAARLASCASVRQSKVDVSAGYETQLTTDVTGRTIQLCVGYPAMAREQPQTCNFGMGSLARDATVAGVVQPLNGDPRLVGLAARAVEMLGLKRPTGPLPIHTLAPAMAAVPPVQIDLQITHNWHYDLYIGHFIDFLTRP